MTKVCDFCGNEFDEDEARDEFEAETLGNYDYLTKCLCAECAIDVINSCDGDSYYEICENCGSKFDPFDAEFELQRITGDDGAEIDMFEKYLCLDCSLIEYEKENRN